MAIPGGRRESRETNTVGEKCPTLAVIGFQGVSRHGSNNFEPPTANESPGAATTATGVNIDKKASNFHCDSSPNGHSTAIQNRIPDRLRRAAKAIGLCAWLDDAEAWNELALILVARLSKSERTGLAFAAMKSLPKDHAEKVSDAALFDWVPEVLT